jgi:splicing factor U2AF subunit
MNKPESTSKNKKSRWGDTIVPFPAISSDTSVFKSFGNTSSLATTTSNHIALAVLPKNETQQERQARKLYLGNIPNGMTGFMVAQFLNEQYKARNLPCLSGTLPVVNVQINVDKNFAFIDCARSEQADHILAFMDGINFKNQVLRVRRPKDYLPPNDCDPATTLKNQINKLGIPDPVPNHEAFDIVFDGPCKIYIGNLNRKIRYRELLDCLWGLGDVKSLKLMKEQDESELNAGFAFLEFKNIKLVDKALMALQGVHLCGSYWVAERHIRPKFSTQTPDYSVPPAAKNLIQKASKILELSGIVEDPHFINDIGCFDHIENDIRIECSHIGRVKSIHLPRERSRKTHSIITNRDESKSISQNIADHNINISENLKNSVSAMKTNFLQQDYKPTVDILCSGSTFIKSTALRIEKQQRKSVQTNSTFSANGIKHNFKNGHGNRYNKTFGFGKIFIEFTRPEVTRVASHNFHNRIFEGRPILTRFYPLKNYQKCFGKGLISATIEEKIQLAIHTQGKLMLSESKLFPNVDLR